MAYQSSRAIKAQIALPSPPDLAAWFGACPEKSFSPTLCFLHGQIASFQPQSVRSLTTYIRITFEPRSRRTGRNAAPCIRQLVGQWAKIGADLVGERPTRRSYKANSSNLDLYHQRLPLLVPLRAQVSHDATAAMGAKSTMVKATTSRSALQAKR